MQKAILTSAKLSLNHEIEPGDANPNTNEPSVLGVRWRRKAAPRKTTHLKTFFREEPTCLVERAEQYGAGLFTDGAGLDAADD